MTIKEFLGEEELLCQLAEESCELGKAALKLRRAINGKNWTPLTIAECRQMLTEEIADCELVLRYLDQHSKQALLEQSEIMTEKDERWKDRLRQHGGFA